MTTQTTDLLMEEIERAERDLMQEGIEKTVATHPYKLQLVLTGRLIREFGSLQDALVNGRNGNRRRDRIRQVAINISVPAVTGAGVYAAVLRFVESLAGG